MNTSLRPVNTVYNHWFLGLQPLRRLFRDGVPEQDQHQNQVVSPPGTAPDYADPPSAPNFEGPFNGIASVTEAVREAEVTAFAHIVTRQAPATEAPREGEGAKPPSFFFELVRAIADLGHGVFSVRDCRQPARLTVLWPRTI